jgi:rhamnopyranosyl-N-acetylglucosaminyl-diphospho-decaprenol beta-1,3/1,4-galactofuranosyltransferase
LDGVAAIIVTFNRKELLARCLEAVLAQTLPAERVFVIDNASTDGTAELLEKKGLLRPQVEYVRLGSNTGSAGGFHEGMKRAHQAGYPWLWLMDDDGYPAADCLERLMSYEGALDVIGPAVVRPDDASRLTWRPRRVHPNGRYKTLQAMGDGYQQLLEESPGGIYPGFAALFNGVLINRRVPAAVGYVLADLFIWGDENEYLWRCKAAGFRVGICVSALHFHATVKPKLSSKWKFYYLYRNTMYMYRRYSDVALAWYIRPFYPAYISLRLLSEIPSLSPPYLLKLIRGAASAMGGDLVPFNESVPARSL